MTLAFAPGRIEMRKIGQLRCCAKNAKAHGADLGGAHGGSFSCSLDPPRGGWQLYRWPWPRFLVVDETLLGLILILIMVDEVSGHLEGLIGADLMLILAEQYVRKALAITASGGAVAGRHRVGTG